MAGAIDLRPDGSSAFKIDEEEIEWRYPKLKHLQAARNGQTKLGDSVREAVADRAGEDADTAAMMDDVYGLVAGWVIGVHHDIAVTGTLPKEVGDWPAWLVTMDFVAAVSEHWGTSPFG